MLDVTILTLFANANRWVRSNSSIFSLTLEQHSKVLSREAARARRKFLRLFTAVKFVPDTAVAFLIFMVRCRT